MRGGWRWNAGRRGWRAKAEDSFRVDLRTLRLAGRGTLTFSRGGEEVGGLAYTATRDELTLHYTLDGEPMDQRVPITRTACFYGGSRPWLVCACQRRCLVLYACRAGFRCRACTRVAYTSQSEDEVGRAWRRQQKAEAKLDAKGIHRSTRDRLLQVIDDAEQLRDAVVDAYIARHPDAFGPDGMPI